MTKRTTQLSLVLGALLLSACSLEPRQLQVGNNDEFTRNAYVAPVGIQTFRQVVASREVTAGAPANNAVIGVFNRSANLFSMDGDALTVSSPMVLALGSVTGAFCDQAYDRDAGLADGERAVYPNVPIGQSPSSFAATARRNFAKHLFRRHLQREGADAEVGVVVTLLDQALGGGAEVKEAAVAACAAVGSSVQSWTR